MIATVEGQCQCQVRVGKFKYSHQTLKCINRQTRGVNHIRPLLFGLLQRFG